MMTDVRFVGTLLRCAMPSSGATRTKGGADHRQANMRAFNNHGLRRAAAVSELIPRCRPILGAIEAYVRNWFDGSLAMAAAARRELPDKAETGSGFRFEQASRPL